MNEDIYRELQIHLDEQPIDFPATNSGSDIRLLKYLFKPRETEIALKLSYNYQSIDDIFELCKNDDIGKAELEEILENMVKRGNIHGTKRDGKNHYRIVPLVVGLDELQVYNLTPEYFSLLIKYMTDSQFPLKLINAKNPQLRTIPIEKSLTPEHLVANYDDVMAIIKNNRGPIVVIDCICKKGALIAGKKCQKTSRLETCIVFNDIAETWLKRGLGRQINKQEAIEITRKNEEDGLVFQPSNAQEPEFLCACCGCCCGIFTMQKAIPNPANFWTSSYQAEVNSELCEGCGTCIDRCQVDAIKLRKSKGVVSINLKRCIGCGNCVPTCPAQAIRLIKKNKDIVIPQNNEELYNLIMKNKKK